MAVPCSIVEGRDSDRDRILTFGFVCMYVCLLLQDLYKSCARGGAMKGGTCHSAMGCYEPRPVWTSRTQATTTISYCDVRHGQTVREEGVDE